MATKKPIKKVKLTPITKGKGSQRTSKIETLATITKGLKPNAIAFVYNYLGMDEDGVCFNNATLSYLKAFNIETSLRKQSDGKYTKEYLNARSRGHELVINRDIQKLKNYLLLETGFDPDNIKRRLKELSGQNKNLPVAHNATRDIAKIAGVMKEDSKSVDIPQLTELTNQIKSILTP